MFCFYPNRPILSLYPAPFLIHPRTMKRGRAETFQLSGHVGKAKALIHVCRHESSTKSNVVIH